LEHVSRKHQKVRLAKLRAFAKSYYRVSTRIISGFSGRLVVRMTGQGWADPLIQLAAHLKVMSIIAALLHKEM